MSHRERGGRVRLANLEDRLIRCLLRIRMSRVDGFLLEWSEGAVRVLVDRRKTRSDRGCNRAPALLLVLMLERVVLEVMLVLRPEVVRRPARQTPSSRLAGAGRVVTIERIRLRQAAAAAATRRQSDRHGGPPSVLILCTQSLSVRLAGTEPAGGLLRQRRIDPRPRNDRIWSRRG